jgi:hypothetical protein
MLQWFKGRKGRHMVFHSVWIYDKNGNFLLSLESLYQGFKLISFEMKNV